MTQNIEELSLNAWPALQTVLYDGWVLRFSNGYTRRANSINPLYPSGLGLDEKLHFCEDFYRARGLPVVFKITDRSQPDDLDQYLSEVGYVKEAATSVQTLDLGLFIDQPAPGLMLSQSLQDEWLEAFCRMSPGVGSHQATLRQMLLNILPAHCFAAVRLDGLIVACGLGVAQSGMVGLFDIVTDSAQRRHGYARQVVSGLLAWGKANQAQNAYLQVMLNNTPALNLYSKMGFSEKYQYWYRVKP